ncbi:LysR family transcriptional regulator [Bdellovibrio bacteriovorus]
MDIDVLKYFKTTARLGNMSRAAQELHISQPTLTVAIRKLEEQLGVTLFERSKKGVSLTSAGEQIYKYSDHLLELYEEMLRNAGSLEDKVKGTLRLGLHPSVACYTLPAFLSQTLKQHPELNVELHHDLSRNVLQDILDNTLDLGLVINPERHGDLVIKELCQDEVTVWKKKGSLSDTLIFDPSLFQTQVILERLQKKGLQYARKISSTNLEVIATLLQSGAGHAILPKRVALNSGSSIEPAHSQISVYKDSLCLVYRPSLKRTATGKALLEAIVNAKI